MFLLTSIQNDVFTVLDTEDMVEEQFPKNEIISFLNSGVMIYGTSLFALENNSDLVVVLRFYKDGEAKDFDGYLLRDVPEDCSEYFYQVIDSSQLSDNLHIVHKLCDKYLRQYNKGLYNLSLLDSDLHFGYKVFSGSSESLVLRGSDNNLYTCDFYTCLYIYLVENVSIDGIDSINANELIFNKYHINGDIILSQYIDSVGSCNAVVMNKCAESGVDEISATWRSIDSLISNKSYVLTSNYMPLFNIKNNVYNMDNYINSQILNKSLNVVGFDAGILSLSDGNKIDVSRNKDLVYSLMSILHFADEDLSRKFESYIKIYETKSSVLGKYAVKKKYCDFIEEGYTLTFDGSYKMPIPYIADTPYGKLEVHGKLEIKYSYIWITRITHMGSVGYSLKDNAVYTGTMKGMKSCLFNAEFAQYLNNCDGRYFHNSICPICISSVRVDEKGVDIRVACLVSCTSDGDWLYKLRSEESYTAYGVVDVPLLLLGSKVIYDNECYLIDMLTCRVILEESLMNNLYTDFNIEELVKTWGRGTNKLKADCINRQFEVLEEVYNKYG